MCSIVINQFEQDLTILSLQNCDTELFNCSVDYGL